MRRRIPFLARALALLWAGFWMSFFVAESWASHTPVRAVLPWLGPGLVFVVLVLTPWHWERTGGLLLLVAGLSAGVAYAVVAAPACRRPRTDDPRFQCTAMRGGDSFSDASPGHSGRRLRLWPAACRAAREPDAG